MINFTLLLHSMPDLLRGLLVTLQIAALGCGIGLGLGTCLGVAQALGPRIARLIVTLYVTLIRGTPMLMQIIFIFYVLPQCGIHIPAFWAATTAIGLNSAAYISQVIRSGIASVSRGQIEAARVLGLDSGTIIYLIILPQAIRAVLPALGNEFITLVKDSSLASTIGVAELSKEGSLIRSRTLDALTVFFGVALLYLIVTTTLSFCVSYLEKRMNPHVKN
jgi:His/Glu/Gln/Arg/opine family amino acid ABC transporter permease subunit